MNFEALLDRTAFHARHIGPDAAEERDMLALLGAATREELVAQAMPAAIRQREPLALPGPLDEAEALAELRGIAAGIACATSSSRVAAPSSASMSRSSAISGPMWRA